MYNSSKGMGIDWKRLHFDDEKQLLSLVASYVDTISIAGAALQSDEPQSKHVSDERIRAHVRQWHQEASVSSQHGDGYRQGAWHEPFTKGLIGDLMGDLDLIPERRSNSQDLAAVQDFLETGIRTAVCQPIFATVSIRTMLVTKGNRIGFGPRSLGVGDQVWIPHGCHVPLVLRPVRLRNLGKDCFQALGPAYVDGIMFRERAPLE